ncbi:hypothetical protein ACOMHN_052198 [Nucella lapillus]
MCDLDTYRARIGLFCGTVLVKLTVRGWGEVRRNHHGVTQRASAGTLSPANQHVEGGEVTGLPAGVTSRDNLVAQEGEDGTRQADRLGYVATLVTRLGAPNQAHVIP